MDVYSNNIFHAMLFDLFYSGKQCQSISFAKWEEISGQTKRGNFIGFKFIYIIINIRISSGSDI